MSTLQKIEFIEYKKDDSIDKENKELEKLLNDIITIKEINENLLSLIGKQKENCNELKDTLTSSIECIDESNRQMVIADEYQMSYVKTKSIIATTAVTMVTVPIVMCVGLKIGLVVGVVGLVGGAVWTIKK